MQSEGGGLDRGRGQRDEEGYDLTNPARSFVSTVRAVLLDPVGFFRRLAPRGRMLNPLVFAIVCALIATPFQLLVAPFDPLAGSNPGLNSLFSDLPSTAGPGEVALLGAIFLLVFLLLVPLVATLSLYIGAGIYHLLVLLFVRPTGTNFEATFRVFAYTSVVALLSWVPVLGLLAALYGYYLAFVGIKEMHETTNGRALAVVLVPAVLFEALVILPFLLPLSDV